MMMMMISLKAKETFKILTAFSWGNIAEYHNNSYPQNISPPKFNEEDRSKLSAKLKELSEALQNDSKSEMIKSDCEYFGYKWEEYRFCLENIVAYVKDDKMHENIADNLISFFGDSDNTDCLKKKRKFYEEICLKATNCAKEFPILTNFSELLVAHQKSDFTCATFISLHYLCQDIIKRIVEYEKKLKEDEKRTMFQDNLVATQHNYSPEIKKLSHSPDDAIRNLLEKWGYQINPQPIDHTQLNNASVLSNSSNNDHNAKITISTLLMQSINFAENVEYDSSMFRVLELCAEHNALYEVEKRKDLKGNVKEVTWMCVRNVEEVTWMCGSKLKSIEFKDQDLCCLCKNTFEIYIMSHLAKIE
jgi:hypothetical protein